MDKKIIFDFSRAGDDFDRLEEEIRGLVHGAKTAREVRARLEGVTILPAPGQVFAVEECSDGFDILFLVGKGQRPRAVHCVEEGFDQAGWPKHN